MKDAGKATSRKKSSKPKDSPTESDQRPHGVSRITNDFLRDIRSLQFAEEETGKVLRASAQKHISAFGAFLRDFSQKKEGTTLKFEVPVERGGELKRLAHELSASAGSLPIFHRGLFLVLVSKWDAYFGSILRWIYRTRPEIIDNSTRTISFAELKEINSIEAAREKIIDDEVSVVLRESHGDQFEYLERKLSVSLRKLDIWPNFIELTQRRNLIAHANGKISDQYLKVCREHNVVLDQACKIGSELEVRPKYLRESCDHLAELGFKLSQVLWRKLQESNRADNHLLDTTYDMLKAEQYDLAIRLLTFALTPPMKLEEARSRYVCVVNLALAHKWLQNEEKCAEIIAKEDWSAVPLDLQLAIAVLRNERNKAISLMKKIGTSGEITKQNYEEWPLFDKLRETTEFVGAYREIFKTEFEIREVPTEVASALALSQGPEEALADEPPPKRERRPRRA